jgi:hypothetical protein
MDFVLSAEGQAVLKRSGRIPAHRSQRIGRVSIPYRKPSSQSSAGEQARIKLALIGFTLLSS